MTTDSEYVRAKRSRDALKGYAGCVVGDPPPDQRCPTCAKKHWRPDAVAVCVGCELLRGRK